MRFKDIIDEAGVIDTIRDIKTGYDIAGKPLQALKSKIPSGPKLQRKTTPFDNVNPKEFKQILLSILNKKELSQSQQQIVKTLYHNL